VFTLLEATIVSDHWGSARYASLNGVFNAPLTAATALAPSIGAALVPLIGGYPAMFGLLAAAGVVGAVLTATAGSPPAPVAAGPGGRSVADRDHVEFVE
jgi:di/tricarboxylate transporter